MDVASTPTESRARERSRSNTRPTHDDGRQSRWDDKEHEDLGIVDRENEVTEALLSFLANDRLRIPMAVAYNAKLESKNTRKEQRGKTLNYIKENKEVREGLDISRATEWNKW